MPLRIGVPLETTPGEKRVATVPDVVAKLIKLGFSVGVQSGAGAVPGPFEAYLTMRGCKTLELRMRRFAEHFSCAGDAASADTIEKARAARRDELILHGYFSVPVENSQLEPIELKLRLLEQPDISSARLDIMGTPLSKDQKIEVSEDESSSIVTATVRDTQELRSWILGLGARAEVIEPAYLRQFVAHTIGLLNEKYSA